jgi:hypothetical protein
MKARLDNEYFPIINAVPKHAGRSSRIWDIGLCGDSAASGTLPHEDGKSGLSSHVFDQGWVFGYFPHAPSLGISESFPIHVEELAKVNIARQVPMPINTVQDRDCRILVYPWRIVDT